MSATRRTQRGGRRTTPARTPAKMEEIEMAGSGKGEDVGHVDLTGKDGPPPEDAWWAFVMPTSEGAPAPIPGGRYGYWEAKPAISDMSDHWMIRSSDVEKMEEEPSVLVTKAPAITVYVAQMKHTINPEAPTVAPGAMTPV